MPSLIPGFEYDIFISYRQKDNKGDKWVSQFVDSLKDELESTFKEEISVYFDINPHDGLLETHDVSASLKEKLRCLIFIPIISRTYCDPNSFAWEHEFKAFAEKASQDNFGLKIKLPNGNVASRVLPIRIYDLDSIDIKLCESILGGLIRGVEFIFKSTGVNRPLTPSDNPDKNLHKTFYRDQINKVANAIKEIISGIKGEVLEFESEPDKSIAAIEETALPEKSIIVLPFENMSSDSEQEYFSDGLTEEIITALSHIHDLLVISRNSAMTFKGTKKKTKEIAREVNVRYVLEGSVRKSGNNLRITAQLIDGLTDSHYWADKYSGTLDDVFDIQEKVSQSIVDSLKIKLIPEEKKKILARPIDNFQVYDLHIKAQNALLASTAEGFKRALQYINQGLEIIGENEILYADMGQVYMHYIELGVDRGETNFKKAEECAEKVFSLNPKSANGYYLRGHLKLWRGNVNESVKDLNQALSIDPNHFSSNFILSMIYITLGKDDPARPIVQKLLKIDPFNSMSYLISGALEIFNGQFNQAVMFLRKGYELEPLPFLKFWVAKALAYNNELKESCQLLNSVSTEAPGTHWAQMALFLLYAVEGEISKALEIVTEDFVTTMKDDSWFAIWTAESYALMGLKEESVEWIEKGMHCSMPFINYPFLLERDPLLETIRSEARFKKLMERVKYEWENFEV